MNASFPTSLMGAAALAGLALTSGQAMAAEGGTSAYLMGSRDSFSGIVPAPGNYFGLDLVTFSGDITGVSINGLPIRSTVDLDVNLAKLSMTHVFDSIVWGGTPAINVNIPILDAGINFDPLAPPALVGSNIEDSTSGIGDITVTPFVGWHRGNLHYSAALSVFVPVGKYDTASVDLSPPVGVDALSNGKNIWTFQPVLSVTHFDPQVGWEVSASASFLFSTRNKATDYQTAPAFTLESAVMKHWKNGFAAGVSGYLYHQLTDDSGTGAENTRKALGADSLRAQAYALGPIVTFSSRIFEVPLNLKAKHYKEFGVKRRFESDIFWCNATMSF